MFTLIFNLYQKIILKIRDLSYFISLKWVILHCDIFRDRIRNLEKYFHEQSVETVFSEEETTQNSGEMLSVESRLGAAIGKRTSSAASAKIVSNDKKVKLAYENYMTTNIMHPSLKQIFDALLLIKPTSIKDEQNFSMSSDFLSKKRKRMDPNTLDDLCFLKSYFIAQQK